MAPTFSISVPIGAWHPLLRECLQSLAIQTPRPNVALLDASGDPRVKTDAGAFDDLIVYRRHGPDGGQSDAILEGWANAPGDILGWLNADDALYPGALARAAAKFDDDENLDVVYGHSVIIDDDFAVVGYHWAVAPPSDLLLSGDIISQPSCFFRRSAYDKAGGLDADLHYTMDWDLWVRLWRDGAKFDFINEVMSRVLWTKEAKTGGFGTGRRKELARIIDQNASPVRRLKSKLGFALHHVFEYMMPPALARALRGRLSPSGAVINGLGRNGEIDNEATLPVVHYLPEPARKLRLAFTEKADISIAAAGGALSASGAAEIVFGLPAAQAPGETLMLTIRNEGASPAIFTGLRFD
ncbi:glycosyltransferase [Hyphococcus sp.]|uniref:glycosyltransferase n=1 Tax=Hyphococcus sp. TaxID=2038636 RepID=UPI0035C73F03